MRVYSSCMSVFNPPMTMHTTTRYRINNALTFQIAWLVCVLAGSWVAVMTTLVVLVLHLQQVHNPRRELVFIVQATVVGFLCDTALIQSGVLITENFLPPLWLTCLWALFATTIGYALHFFLRRPWLSLLAGGFFAPLSYFAGARLAGINLMTPPWLGLLLIALMWALVFPLLNYLYRCQYPCSPE